MASNAQNPLIRHLPRPVSVPRRFGMSIMLLAMTLVSLLFYLLRLLEVPSQAVLAVTLFFVFIALAQMVRPTAPRLASVVTGAGYFAVLASSSTALAVKAGYSIATLWLVAAVAASLPLGACFGYLGGAVMAGVFLLLGWRSEDEPPRSPQQRHPSASPIGTRQAGRGDRCPKASTRRASIAQGAHEHEQRDGDDCYRENAL